MTWLERLKKAGMLLFDGAIGTMLQQGGLPPGHIPEEWNLSRPEKVKEVHSAYAAAGVDIVETNSFGGNRVRLAHYYLAEQLAVINKRAVELAREAVGESILVAAAIGPTGRFLSPAGDLDPGEAVEIYAQQVEALAAAGPDLLLIETMSDLAEVKCAVDGARSVCRLPILVQMTFSERGRTMFGVTPEQAVLELAEIGVNAVGANCSLGPEELLPLVERMCKISSLPVSAQPNAGMPLVDETGKTVYPFGPEEYAAWGVRLAAAGAVMIGGCCGTTPRHIAALGQRLKG